jgi:ABC-2 type transport system permease protein
MDESVVGDAPLRRPIRKAPPLQVVWVIAWRHIKESLHNRSTYLMAVLYLLVPLILVLFTLRPALAKATAPNDRQVAGALMAFYLLMAGLLPANWAVGIAAGAFAAEKEQGSLTPLLATPASNASIFAGKVIGAVVPALTLALSNVAVYLLAIAVLFGPAALGLMPVKFALLMLALLPVAALLGAGLSSMISARVNTEQSATQYGSLILTVITVGLFFLVLRVTVWGLGVFSGVVALLYVVSIALILISARTWRREEVMARRDA